METLAWGCALSGFALGAVLSVVPGFPGCAVSLLGLVAYAGLTDFAVLPREALPVAAGLTLLGAASQVAAPAMTSRALGGAAGGATGAALGGALGVLVPLPGLGWLLALLGALGGGLIGTRSGWKAWLRGTLGAAGGCLTGAVLDLLVTLALAAVLGWSDFRAAWP